MVAGCPQAWLGGSLHDTSDGLGDTGTWGHSMHGGVWTNSLTPHPQSPQCPHSCHGHSAGVVPAVRGHPCFRARSHRCHWVWGHYYYIYINIGVFLMILML